MLTHSKQTAYLMLMRLRGCFQGGGAANSCGKASIAFLAGEVYLGQNTTLLAFDIGQYLPSYSHLQGCILSYVCRSRRATRVKVSLLFDRLRAVAYLGWR